MITLSLDRGPAGVPSSGMSRRRRWLALLTTALLLISAGAAAAAPGQVSLHGLPPFANGPQVLVTWDAAAFTPGSAGRQYRVSVQDLTVPGLTSRVVPASSTEATLTLVDGHEYAIRVIAEERECVAPGVCDSAHINGPASETRTTRVDSSAPLVAAQINGGAPYTNDPAVVLDVSAQDPAVAGRPASGVRTLEVSQTGAFSCSALSGADCRIPFAPSVPLTLSPGPDGPRTVSVRALDGATTAGPAPPSPDGNASAPAQATVLLDRLAPTPKVGMSAPSAKPGVPLALGARRSVDGVAGAADSGLDPSGFLWSFGDGSVGRGALVQHVYARLGTYKGTLTLSDRAGNAATAAFTVFVGDRTGIVVRGRGRVLAPDRLAGLAARRTTLLVWRPNARASFYNVQLYRARIVRGAVVRRLLVSTFPRRPRQTLPGRLLRPGTYHLVVWSGLESGQRASYAGKPWIVVVLKVARPGS
jgi:PKD domain